MTCAALIDPVAHPISHCAVCAGSLDFADLISNKAEKWHLFIEGISLARYR
jgi:hypothetical protein